MRSHTVIGNIRLIVETVAIEHGCDPGLACDLAAAVDAKLHERFGGDQVYFPRMHRERIRMAIENEFDGNNRENICRNYGISRATFYRILGETRK